MTHWKGHHKDGCDRLIGRKLESQETVAGEPALAEPAGKAEAGEAAGETGEGESAGAGKAAGDAGGGEAAGKGRGGESVADVEGAGSVAGLSILKTLLLLVWQVAHLFSQIL